MNLVEQLGQCVQMVNCAHWLTYAMNVAVATLLLAWNENARQAHSMLVVEPYDVAKWGELSMPESVFGVMSCWHGHAPVHFHWYELELVSYCQNVTDKLTRSCHFHFLSMLSGHGCFWCAVWWQLSWGWSIFACQDPVNKKDIQVSCH